MTAWSWAVADLLNMMTEDGIGDLVENMLLSGIAPSTILSNICA
jgi:hypothetical protein